MTTQQPAQTTKPSVPLEEQIAEVTRWQDNVLSVSNSHPELTATTCLRMYDAILASLRRVKELEADADTARIDWLEANSSPGFLALRRQLAEANGALLRASAQLNGDGAIIGDGARIADASQLRALAGVKHG